MTTDTIADQTALREEALRQLEAFEPQTQLGRDLKELRRQILLSGETLLSREEVIREVEERRGGQGRQAE